MKKFIVFAAISFGMAGWAYSDSRDVPRGNIESLATADYGGVSVDVSTFSTASRLVRFIGVVQSVVFSSGSCNDFVTIRDTMTVYQPGVNDLMRVYNTKIASVAATGVTQWCAGEVPFQYPLRISSGTSWNVSTGLYNEVILGYTKFQTNYK